jgi:hypothetical protein
MPLTKRPKISERRKYIYRIADIVKQNVIEFVAWRECLPKLVLVWERDFETKGRIPLLRDFHYLVADIDAFASTWFDGS